MPIETSPIPFSDQQLPYAPKFVPGAIDEGPFEIAPNGTILNGGGGGSVIGSMMDGQGMMAAGNMIDPTPGGIAQPHRAIPALPDAGYTAPTLRAVSIFDASQSHGEGSVLALHQMEGYPPSDYPYPEAFAASLPEPRRAPVPPPSLGSRHHRHITPHEDHSATRCNDHQHHQPEHQNHHRRQYQYTDGSNTDDDFDDGASDASYYAMPKLYRRRSTSRRPSISASPDESASPEILADKHTLYRRTISNQFEHDGHLSPHSPHSPQPHRSHNSPQDQHFEENDLDSPRRGRRHSLNLSNLSLTDSPSQHLRAPSLSHYHSRERSRQASIRPGMPRKSSNLATVPGSLSDSEEIHNRREKIRGRSGSRLSRNRTKEDDDADDEGPEYQPGLRRANRARHTVEREEREESPYHSPRIMIDPPPLPPSSSYSNDMERGRRHRHSNSELHSHHSHHAPHQNDHHSHHHQNHRRYLDDYQHRHHLSDSEIYQPRRRALSEHSFREYLPPPRAGTLYPTQSASVMGESPQGAYMNAIGIEGPELSHEMYGAAAGVAPSVAGTGMTFMDGSIGGRVSQYGLPKYPHNPKVDYRRFCVQRGKADVFLD